MALVALVGGLTPGFQPEMVPSSVAKMKIACVPGLPGTRRKSVLPLKTTPVGADWVPGAKPGGGTVTTSGPPFCFGGKGVPLRAERVEVPGILFATHQGLPDEVGRAQRLLKIGPIVRAISLMYAATFTC